MFRMRLRRHPLCVGLVTVTAILSAGTLVVSAELIVLTPVQRANAHIETVVLDTMDAPSATGLTITGRIEPGAGARTVITAPVAARVVDLQALPGTTVRAGQKLLVLAGIEIAGLQRARREAQAASSFALQRVKRDRMLLKEGIIASSRLEQSEAALAAASAQLRQTRSATPGMDAASRDGELIVRAPVPGVVAGPRLAVGDRVEMGDTLAILGTPRDLRVALSASADVARSLRAGDTLIVRGRGCEAPAVLQSVGVSIESNQTVVASASITDRETCLLPGETVTASIAPRTAAAGSWALPARAFVRRGAETFVFAERATGFEPVQVDAQSARAGFARSSALKRGDKVAITGSALLKGAWIGIAEE